MGNSDNEVEICVNFNRFQFLDNPDNGEIGFVVRMTVERYFVVDGGNTVNLAESVRNGLADNVILIAGQLQQATHEGNSAGDFVTTIRVGLPHEIDSVELCNAIESVLE